MDAADEQHPERVRVRLHPLAHVPHQAVAGEEIVDGPQGDVRVVDQPAVPQGDHGKHQQQDGESG